MKLNFIALLALLYFTACNPDDNPAPDTSAKLVISFNFNKDQPRLNNLGQPSSIPQGNAALTPDFHGLSLHYIELAPNAFTLLGKGAIVYKGAETEAGGENAVDFDKAIVKNSGEIFTKISLKDVPPGTYEWVRVSVTYQNYEVKFNLKNLPVIGGLNNQQGTVASFVGFNTYIKNITPKQKTLAVNDDKKQGFWAFETAFSSPYDQYDSVFSGEAPAGATTVVNPLFQSSPIPPGSCVVTGKFATPLVITGDEKEDIEAVLSFSINNSFEWVDTNGNGQIDLYADDPAKNEKVVDMGLRGLIATWK